MDQSKVRTTPMDFFLQLGVFAALFVSVISLLNLLFNTIDAAFPDALSGGYSDPYAGALRFAIASLIIVFPLYLYLSWFVSRDYEKHPEKRTMAIRKWLLYLTLFIAGGSVVVDLIVLINTFLGGELTTRFVLKIISVLVVAAAVFWYYLSDARRDRPLTGSVRNSMIVGALLVVAVSIASGFYIMGSPDSLRAKRLDDQRISDLGNIQWQVVQFWQQKQKLPKDLFEVNDSLSGNSIPQDPQTGEAYTYLPTGDRMFKICANFSSSGTGDSRNTPYPMLGEPAGKFGTENWKHGAGVTCFERTIDPERYPPIPSKTLSY